MEPEIGMGRQTTDNGSLLKQFEWRINQVPCRGHGQVLPRGFQLLWQKLGIFSGADDMEDGFASQSGKGASAKGL